MTPYPPIVYATQYGGKDAQTVVHPVIRKIMRVTENLGTSHFGDPIRSLSFVFRVDGCITQFMFSGCQLPKIDKKQGYATVDIGIPREIWSKDNERELLKYVAKSIEEGYQLLANLLKKEEGIDFDFGRAAAEVVSLCKIIQSS